MDLGAIVDNLGGGASSDTLRARGATPSQIAVAVRRGELVAVRRGAYVRPGAGATETYRRTCLAIARGRPDEALSHASAVAMHGLPLVDLPTRIHLVRPGVGRAQLRPPSLIVRGFDGPTLPLPDHPDVQAVPLATALVQMCLVERRRTALACLDAALHAEQVTEPELMAALEVWDGRRGPTVAWLIELADARIESPGESVLRLGLLELGITVTPQVVIRDAQGFVGRVDFLDEAARTVWEFDGAVKYDGVDGRQALVAEKRREDRLRAAGYRVVRVMWRDLEPTRLRQLAAVAAAA